MCLCVCAVQLVGLCFSLRRYCLELAGKTHTHTHTQTHTQGTGNEAKLQSDFEAQGWISNEG